MERVIAYMDDLMFLSRIREAARPAGLDVASVRSPAALLEACRLATPAIVFVDLDGRRLGPVEAIRALRATPEGAAVPVVGFFNHVHVEEARAAEAAGCTRVLTRGAFVKELPALVRP